jgi:hypothetical protein
MARIIREKYENGVLVERHIEGSKFKPRKWLMVFAHLVIAASLAVLAAVNVIDSLAARASLADESSPASCREAPGFRS